jgi:hypothetical protein
MIIYIFNFRCHWHLWFETFQYPQNINIHKNNLNISISTKYQYPQLFFKTFQYLQNIKIHNFWTFDYLWNINIHNSQSKLIIFIKLCDKKTLKHFILNLVCCFHVQFIFHLILRVISVIHTSIAIQWTKSCQCKNKINK